MEALKVLLQLFTSPDFADWGDQFMADFQEKIVEDEEKAQVLLELMEYLGSLQEDDEDLEWIERKKDELKEFLAVIKDLEEFLPEAEDY